MKKIQFGPALESVDLAKDLIVWILLEVKGELFMSGSLLPFGQPITLSVSQVKAIEQKYSTATSFRSIL